LPGFPGRRSTSTSVTRPSTGTAAEDLGRLLGRHETILGNHDILHNQRTPAREDATLAATRCST
jgi:hypothetical protein